MKTVRARIEELERKTTPAPAKLKVEYEIHWPDDTDYTLEPGDVVLNWPEDPPDLFTEGRIENLAN